MKADKKKNCARLTVRWCCVVAAIAILYVNQTIWTYSPLSCQVNRGWNFARLNEAKKTFILPQTNTICSTQKSKKSGMLFSFSVVPYTALILQIQIQIRIFAHLLYDGVFHFSCGSRSVLSKELWQFQLKQKCIVLIASYMGMQIYAQYGVRVASVHWQVITAREIRHTHTHQYHSSYCESTKPTSKRSKMVVTQFSTETHGNGAADDLLSSSVDVDCQFVLVRHLFSVVV